MHRPDRSILARGHDHVVGHADQAVDRVGMARILVTVVPVLSLNKS